MKHIQTFENHGTIINKSELDKDLNLNAEYNIAKKNGLKPYQKLESSVEEIKPSKISQTKNVIYLTEEEAKEINKVGKELKAAQDKFDKELKIYHDKFNKSFKE